MCHFVSIVLLCYITLFCAMLYKLTLNLYVEDVPKFLNVHEICEAPTRLLLDPPLTHQSSSHSPHFPSSYISIGLMYFFCQHRSSPERMFCRRCEKRQAAGWKIAGVAPTSERRTNQRDVYLPRALPCRCSFGDWRDIADSGYTERRISSGPRQKPYTLTITVQRPPCGYKQVEEIRIRVPSCSGAT